MTDTLALTLKENMFQILEPDKFTPSADWIFKRYVRFGGKPYFSCTQNPSAFELKNGYYKPRLTLIKRFLGGSFYEITLKIEFSAPKMVFGNNFDELTENDFSLVIEFLQKAMNDMGVKVTRLALENASVSTIHYSKNVLLNDGLTPLAILKEIQKANISQRLDFNQTDFSNGGHSLKFRTNSYEITFYDKMKDMQKAKISNKRAIEKDNGMQMNLFGLLEARRRLDFLEVIRMEVRLNKKEKILQMLKTVNCETEPTFKNLFKLHISQKILIHYLDLIKSCTPQSIYYDSKSAKDFLSEFVISNPKKKLSDAVIAYGFRSTLKELSTRELRTLFRHTPVRSWYSFIKRMNSYQFTSKNSSYLEIIVKAVTDYEPLRVNDYEV